MPSINTLKFGTLIPVVGFRLHTTYAPLQQGDDFKPSPKDQFYYAGAVADVLRDHDFFAYSEVMGSTTRASLSLKDRDYQKNSKDSTEMVQLGDRYILHTGEDAKTPVKTEQDFQERFSKQTPQPEMFIHLAHQFKESSDHLKIYNVSFQDKTS